MKIKILPMLIIFLQLSLALAAPAPKKVDETAEFKQKLNLMYVKTEKSIKILREQIIQNQSVPFLADLFLQLADLLSEKSNILYYQQMEKEKSTDIKLDVKQKLNPIVVTLQEAIDIYKQLLKEFPNFNKRDKVLYRLAVAQKSIDEAAAFTATAETLCKGYPKTKECMQVRLMLGQFYFDQQDFKAAAEKLMPAANSEFPFERNSARYRLGLISMSTEKYAEALQYFEKITTDSELKEEDNPMEVSIKTRAVNSNIKREALIDSVRAFTEVYKKNPDPIAFYNRISPSEALFQEAIEKLAYRYIFLKNETQAMGLLRTLSERVADPQKVVNIYQEVLRMIPPMERIEVPHAEMEYVLGKYNDWITYFEVPLNTQKESYKFFETQIREMGTKSHDLGKSELSQTRKDSLYERARNFYHLYLGFFNKGPEAVKIATNLADVYYYQKQFQRSGDLYLRTYQGEFGPAANKEALLQNAILCFQKPAPSDFYQIVRNRGLLVKAIQSYMQLDAKKKNDPKLNFILVKSTYEQGIYNKALPGLINFIAKYPNAKQEVEAAADIGLDYYNIRSDFKGLVAWSQKVLALNTIPTSLRTRLQNVKSKALLKKIDEEVKGKSNYDAFAQGKIYFEKALSMQDDSLKSVVLEQALARSKAEKDVNTFLKVAKTLAAAERSPDKRAGILVGMAEQTLAMGRFNQTFDIWNEILADSKVPEAARNSVRDKSLRLALMMNDWGRIERSLARGGISDTLKQNALAQIGQYMDSGAQISEDVFSSVRWNSLSADELLPYFKGQFKVSSSLRSQINQSTQSVCSGADKSALVCRWVQARELPLRIKAFKDAMEKAPTALQSVEPTALKLNALILSLRSLEETGDPALDIYTALYKSRGFQYFAEYLKRVGIANKQVADVLSVKATESVQNAKQEYVKCSKIIAASALVSPINKYCINQQVPSLESALTWRKTVSDRGSQPDPKSGAVDSLQKAIFVDSSKATNYMELAEVFYRSKHYRHAIALSNYGISTFPDAKEDFSAVLGCSLSELGLYSQASFHLKNASDFKNLKSQCLPALKARIQ